METLFEFLRSGPQSIEIALALKQSIYDLLRRAGYEDVPDEKNPNWRHLRKRDVTVYTYIVDEPNGNFSLCWTPPIGVVQFESELRRIVYASRASQAKRPCREVFVSSPKSPAGDEVLNLLRSVEFGLKMGEHSGESWFLCGDDITLYSGVAMDQDSSSICQYIAIDYALVSIHFIRRRIGLRRVRRFLSNSGFSLVAGGEKRTGCAGKPGEVQ